VEGENSMQTTLEQAIEIIKTLPIEDYAKIREILCEEENKRCDKIEAEINPKRAVEVLQLFHDDFYNEEKNGFSQRELKEAVRWVLLKYDEQRRQ